MKIAFWGNAKGKCGVTSNLACISVASSIEYSHRAVMIENHCQKNKLENVLIYNLANYHMRKEANYNFKHVGMNYLINHLADRECEIRKKEKYQIDNKDTFLVIDRAYKSDLEIVDSKRVIKNRGELDYGQEILKESMGLSSQSLKLNSNTIREKEVSKLIKEVSIEILSNSLYYIPPNHLTNNETFEYDLYGNINHILNTLDTFADITYIDTTNGNNLSSKIILNEVDLIVVNLIQDASIIKNFFDNYSSILSKCVFIISSYRKEIDLNVNKISKNHFINKSSIATIPYNMEYQEAIAQGTIVDFLYHNYSCKKTDPNYKFIQDVRKTVTMIMSHLENCN